MSKNSNDQNIVAESKVLTTSMSRTVAKYTALFAAIGLLIGMIVMVILNLGVPEMVSSFFGQVAVEEVVAHNASSEGESSESEATGIEAILKECGVDFFKNPEQYTGKEIVVEATNVDKLAARGVSVTYANNRHINAGTYEAVAVFSAEGYEPYVWKTELKIIRADITGITFEDALLEYREGTEYEVKVNGEIPDGVEVTYSFGKLEEVGVYDVTAVLYGDNYNNLVLNATYTIVDLTKLVYFPGLKVIDEETGEKAIVLTYNKNEQTIALNTSKVLPEILNNRNFKVTYDVNTFVDAGTYTMTATVSADDFTTFEVPATVIVNQGDIKGVYGFSYGVDKLEYNGDNKEAWVKYSKSENEADFLTYSIKYFSVSGEGENAVYTPVESVCNPGKYRAVIEVIDTTGNCKDYTGEDAIEYDFEVTKRNVSGFYSIKDVTTTYQKVEVKQEDGTTKKVDKVNYFTMTFNAWDLHDTITAQPLVVTFTNGRSSIEVVFTFASEELKDENGEPLKDANGNVQKKYWVVSSYVENGEEITQIHEYDGTNKNVKFTIPFGFVDQGEYAISAVVSGNEFDADTKLTANMEIKYATLSDVSVKNWQWTFADGTLHTPKATGKGTNGANFEFYDKKGNLVEGFKYFGFHQVKVVVTNGNYQTSRDVTYIVMFNPVIAILCMLVGMLLGSIVGAIIGVYTTNREKASAKHFRGPGAIVAKARGGILCESFAKNDNSGCVGRLYLSEKSLEFYAEDYKSLKDNFLIDIDDIRNVKPIAPNKIHVYANKENYVFTVPDGTSAEWTELIIHA